MNQGAVTTALIAVLCGAASLATTPASAAESCPNQQFRTGPSAALDQCRAYEMVSPLDKNGQEITTIAIEPHATVQVADDGNSFAYPTLVPLPETESGTPVQQNIAVRTSSGWNSRSVSGRTGTAPLQFFSTNEALSGDLHSWAMNSNLALTPEAEGLGGRPAIYLASGSEGAVSYTLLTKRAPELGPPPFYLFGEPFVVEATTPDLSTVVFSSTLQLLPGAGPEGFANLYAWSGGILRYASALPAGYEASTRSEAGARSAGILRGNYQGYHRLSADGRRLYFTVAEPLSSSGIWLRNLETDETTLVSASQRAGDDPTAPASGTFELASEDGRVAYFRSPIKLTEGATAAPGDEDLYRWQESAAPGSRLTDLTTADPAGAGVLGTVGGSSDGDVVYFVATGALVPGAVAGEPHLYVWRAGDGVSLVATLAPSDEDVWSIVGAAEPRYRAARVASDGESLLFTSRAALTPYETGGHRQAYLYRAGSGGSPATLECVSCNPRAAASSADVSLFELPTGVSTVAHEKLPANLLSDGQRAIFQTAEALVPGDTNGRQDVYLWEAGKLRLMSDGSAGFGSEFIGASADGKNVFFVTRARLVPSDSDDLADIYDSRVDGGIASQHETRSPPCLSEGDCRAPSPGSPTAPGPASAKFAGPGNRGERRATCSRFSVKAKRLSTRARTLRRRAGKAAKHDRASNAKRLRRKANRLGKRAGRESKRAKRCHKSWRGGK